MGRNRSQSFATNDNLGYGSRYQFCFRGGVAESAAEEAGLKRALTVACLQNPCSLEDPQKESDRAMVNIDYEMVKVSHQQRSAWGYPIREASNVARETEGEAWIRIPRDSGTRKTFQ